MLYRVHISKAKGLVNARAIVHPDTLDVLVLPWELLGIASIARCIDAGIDYVWFNPRLTF